MQSAKKHTSKIINLKLTHAYVIAYYYCMQVITTTQARQNLYKLVDETNQNHSEIYISGKRGNAVLLSEDDWRSIQETLHLLSIPNMRESIIEGGNTPLENCKTELSW